ncbi:sigma-70 family RNA polymerase sigma factor [Peribacillus frigoritolerans]|nr:sigma-70 family RNA polymerase sigma factor [Peribacillus frigoritolerans]
MHVKKKMDEASFFEVNETTEEIHLETIMEQYGDMVVRLAYTYVKQKTLAEDIAQEVFISCYQHMDKFRNQSSVKTWIYRITVNKCKDELKSWSFKNLFYTDLISSFFKNGTNTTELKLLDLEENRWISKIILSLPLKLREVIILYYYEDLSILEIADLLNVNENTIKTRLYRARNLLKSIFKEGNMDGR